MNLHKLNHDHQEQQRPDLFDLSLKYSLKNWAVRKSPPTNIRQQLLEVAAQQEVAKPRQRIPKFHIGWSFLIKSNLSEVAVRSLYGYALEGVSFKTSMAMSIR